MERAVPHFPADDLRVGKAPTSTLAILLLLVAVGARAQPSGMSVEDFVVADQVEKTSVLTEIAAARENVAIDRVIMLVRAGLHDSEADVRVAALGAVTRRVMTVRWAGTSGPWTGPSPGPPPPPRRIIPAERKGDLQALRDALEDDCLALLKGDPDERVRYQALLAVGNLERPVQAEGPLAERMIRLLVDLYRHDSSDRIRAEVVKTFRLVPNNTPEMRGVLRDALVDPSEAIQSEGLTGITPQATATPRRLSFDEARETLVAALAHSDSGIRLGAVRALNVFGVPAAPFIQNLERLRDTDPDPHVRASAGLAIESIQRAVRGPEAP